VTPAAAEPMPSGDVDVVSVVPGRMRLRARRRPLDGEALAALGRALEAVGAVGDVELRAHSSSAVIRFDAGHEAAVLDGLRALGVDVPEPRAAWCEADPAAVIGEAVSAVNRAVARRVPGSDLRLLVPLGLGLLSARQMVRGRDRVGDAPWYVLAWYASETFLRFHGPPPPARRLVTSARRHDG
jgi:hypothetical protein